MKTKTYEVYKFNELPEEAKTKVLENYRDINTDYEWYDMEFDYWKSELETLGYLNAKIYFTGFCSQGDGACFTADIDLVEWLKAHKLSKKYSELLKYQDCFTYSITHRSNYYYSTSTDVEQGFFGQPTRKAENQAEEVLKLIEAEREKLGNKIFKDLEEDYFARTEDKAIIETLECNDYDFTLDGKID